MVRLLLCLAFSILLSTSVNSQMSQARTTGAEIRGRVVDFFGKPFAGALVKVGLEAGANVQRETRTDHQGQYSFKDLPEGNYELMMLGDFGTLKEIRKTRLIQDGEVLEIDFGIEVGLTFCVPKQIYGIVRNSEGRALENSTVSLISPYKQDFRRTTKSGKNGEFIVEVCVGGQYIVYAFMPGYEIQVRNVTVPKDTSKTFQAEINFVLRALIST